MASAPALHYKHNIVNTNRSDNISTKQRVAVLGMSPAFITDVLRMNELRLLHDEFYNTLTVSELPARDLKPDHNHITTDFSTARGWNELLENFFSVIVLDYSWFQRKHKYLQMHNQCVICDMGCVIWEVCNEIVRRGRSSR